MTLLLNIFN